MLSVKVYGDATEQLLKVSFIMDDLAEAMERTGQDRVCRELHGLANVIRKQSDTINSQVGKDLGEMVKNVDQHSTNMLMACFAGAALATNDKKLAKTVKKMSARQDKKYGDNE
jgi:Fic family protein